MVHALEILKMKIPLWDHDGRLRKVQRQLLHPKNFHDVLNF